VHFNESEFEKAIIVLEKAFEIVNEKELGFEQQADILTRLGQVCQFKKVFGKAQNFYERAINLYVENLSQKSDQMVKMYLYTGQMFVQAQEYEQAVNTFYNEINTGCLVYGEHYEGVAAALYNLGNAYKSQRNFSKSLTAFEQALQVKHSEKQASLIYTQMGMVHSELGSYSKALKYHQYSLELKQKNQMSEVSIAQTYGHLSSVCLQLNQLESSMKYALKERNLVRDFTAPDHAEMANCHLKVANVLIADQKYTRARQELALATKIIEDNQKRDDRPREEVAQAKKIRKGIVECEQLLRESLNHSPLKPRT